MGLVGSGLYLANVKTNLQMLHLPAVRYEWETILSADIQVRHVSRKRLCITAKVAETCGP